jgi:hypothetical protein
VSFPTLSFLPIYRELGIYWESTKLYSHWIPVYTGMTSWVNFPYFAELIKPLFRRNMIFKKYDDIYCIRLIHQENFLEMLEKFAKDNNLENAIILSGVGMLKNAEIGYFDNGKYIVETIERPTELVSTNGNMFINPSGKPEWHIHVALAQKTHKMVGGHLLKGIVWNTAEIFIQTIPGAKFVREMEDDNLRLNFK